jgi:hypothetical protein
MDGLGIMKLIGMQLNQVHYHIMIIVLILQLNMMHKYDSVLVSIKTSIKKYCNSQSS